MIITSSMHQTDKSLQLVEIKNDMIKNENENITYSSRPISPDIMNQIQRSHPEIHNLFPYHLGKKNAIDKYLMNAIIHGAVKGQGPLVMSETIKSWHHLCWQKKRERINGLLMFCTN